MNKVFLYLFPIEEYINFFLFSDDSLYDKHNIKRPLPILNECIQKRYRDQGYNIYFLTYPDKDIFGIDIKDNDKIIKTDIKFEDNSAYDEFGHTKENFKPKYADNKYILDQLNNPSELIVGGFHFNDCVKRFAESTIDVGIPTLIDIDLTDLFFSLYKKDYYFKIDEYNKDRYKEYLINEMIKYDEPISLFDKMYDSPAFGFNEEYKKNTK